jgi:hypothetical protein
VKSYPPSSAWAEIIAKAAVSPMGIAALTSLIVGFVVIALIPRSDKPSVRVAVLVLLMLFCGGLMGGAIYSVRPVVASGAVAAGAASAASNAVVVPAPSTTASQVTAASPPAPAPVAPPPAAVAARTDCGANWTGWIEVGNAVGSPCPKGCSRGDELGQSYRVVGFPPRPQTQHKFQCWRP